MFRRRHCHHELESRGSLTATIDEPSSILAHDKHICDTAKLFIGNQLGPAARLGASSERANELGQKLRPNQLNIDQFLETPSSNNQLVRSRSEPILSQEGPQQEEEEEENKCRASWRRPKLFGSRKAASEDHGHRLGEQNLVGAAVSSGAGTNGELPGGIMLWRSVRSLWRLGYFWIDFVHYQLETWIQLAGQLSLASFYARTSSPVGGQDQQADKMSTSNHRWSTHRPGPGYDNQHRRPFISAANRSQSEAVHYYSDSPEVHCDPGARNSAHHQYRADVNLYPTGPNEMLRTDAQPSMPPAHYTNQIYGGQFKLEQLRHPHLTKMNTMDGSPVAHRRRAPLMSQRTFDSGRPSTPNSYATQLLGDRFSVTSSSGSQLAFYSSGLPPTTDFQIVDAADGLRHLYADGRPNHGRQPQYSHHYQRPMASDRCYGPGQSSVAAVRYGDHRQLAMSQPMTRPTNVSSSTNHPSHYSQSQLPRQQVLYAQRHRASNRQTAISSDSELQFPQRQSINLGGLTSRQQVSTNTVAQQALDHEQPARPFYRQTNAVSAGGRQHHEFATDSAATSGILQRNATVTARNSKKSPNLVKLSLEGAKRRLGFKQESGRLSQLTIQRSEEVLPFDSDLERLQDLIANSSLADANHSRTLGPESSSSHCPSPFHWSLTGSGTSRSPFIEGLGPGQVHSRQALVSPDIGDLMLTLCNRHGALEITVIKARRLHLKLGTTQKPSPYIKVYLIKDKKCIAKWKTLPAIRTLEPEYRQSFIYRGDFSSCAVQIIVWGDYGRKDRKSFMGIVQICTDDLELSSTITAWYKLFNAPSMINLFNSSKQMRQQMLPKRLGHGYSKSH